MNASFARNLKRLAPFTLSTMGKEISFAPFNYMTDDVSPIKHLQEDLYTYSTPDREAEPVPTCASTV
eukprot:6184852-Pleurochrysis_carterae.AAC.1